jgi:ribonuclease HI
MPWTRQRLRDAEVWAKVDADGAPITDREGRVEVVYKVEANPKVYRAAARNLTALGGDAIEIAVGEPAPAKAAPAAKSKAGGGGAVPSAPENAVHVWTDGGCSPNPGPGGIGVVVVDGGKHQEIAEFMGNQSTNNICELTAIQRGLEQVADKTRPVIVYSDSQYAIGLLGQGWKAKANVELVAKIRELCKQFPHLKFVKVLAHSGIALNERVDQLVAIGRSKGR